MALLRRQILLCFAIFIASAALTGGAMGEKGKRPTVSEPIDCHGYDCEGPICACCYDDGCWICDARKDANGNYEESLPAFFTCEWEPAFRRLRKGFTIIPPDGGVLDPGPPVTNPRPYRLPGGSGVFSK